MQRGIKYPRTGNHHPDKDEGSIHQNRICLDLRLGLPSERFHQDPLRFLGLVVNDIINNNTYKPICQVPVGLRKVKKERDGLDKL
jgi:hypothetical protein